MTPAVPWEGEPTGLKARRGRGSAAGSAMAGNPWHRMAGYTARMVPLSACGLAFESAATMNTLRAITHRERAMGAEPRCPKCWEVTP